MNAIEGEKLCVQFKRVPVLKEVSFTVPESTVCALLGPNGAGKTTLLRTLINIYQPSSGRATLLGRETTKLKPEDFEE